MVIGVEVSENMVDMGGVVDVSAVVEAVVVVLMVE